MGVGLHVCFLGADAGHATCGKSVRVNQARRKRLFSLDVLSGQRLDYSVRPPLSQCSCLDLNCQMLAWRVSGSPKRLSAVIVSSGCGEVQC